MKKTATFLLAFLFLSVSFLNAQNRSKVRFKPDQIKKMSTVILEKDGFKYPKSYLYRMDKDSITLICPVRGERYAEQVYCQKKMAFDDWDYLTVSKRSERVRYSLICGLAVGTLSYILTKNALQGDINDEPNLRILGQQANPGRIEATIMGVTGFGLGILIGDLLSDKKVDLRRNQRRKVKELKRYSYR